MLIKRDELAMQIFLRRVAVAPNQTVPVFEKAAHDAYEAANAFVKVKKEQKPPHTG